MRRLTGSVLVLGLVLWTATVSLAQYGGSESPTPPPPSTPSAAGADAKVVAQLRTGVEHARNAAGSGAMASAVSHLGHVLNCIEGTRGRNFNASWGHVCQGQGDGILTDIKGMKNADNLMLVLESADQLAAAGVKARELGAVQSAARGVGALLQIVLDGTR
ncbi:MAG TPA: hypothetical protein VJ206_02980 [bacterium]|nr:hypothetical protein [bacterium]